MSTSLVPPMPGPRGGALFGNLMRFHRDPIGFLEANARLGDVAGFRFMGMPAVQLNHPEALRQVLVNKDGAFIKGMAVDGFRPLIGRGLLLAEGQDHLRQRRLMLPGFHRERVAGFGEIMLEEARRASAGWAPGQALDLDRALMGITLRVAARALLGAEVAPAEIEAVGRAMAAFVRWYHRSSHPLAPLLQRLPDRTNRDMRRGRRALEALVGRVLAEREARPGEDLLSMLLEARDEDGRPMDRARVVDEAITLLVAGHETTAASLGWAFAFLAEQPAWAARLRDEAEAAAPGRALEAGDISRLPLARQVFAETLRLRPSAVALPRQVAAPVEVGGHPLAPGTLLLLGVWCAHRDARFWEAPQDFDPERFAPGRAEGRPKHAYLPFSSGARSCIGEAFAWMEGTLVLAELCRGWRAALAPGHVVEAEARFTLRAKGGLPMILAQA